MLVQQTASTRPPCLPAVRHQPHPALRTWWPGVSSRLIWTPAYSNVRAVDVMDMPAQVHRGVLQASSWGENP